MSPKTPIPDVVQTDVTMPRSGISPHERAGHHAPDQFSKRDMSAIAANEVIRQPPPGDDVTS